jgi:signal transduction histidine kinase/HAMP domain-containing protein
MKIRLKLTLGVGLLFTFIILLTLIGTRQISSLAGDTRNILRDNYNTLDYARQMLGTLDQVQGSKAASDLFRQNMERQQANITERGEREATNSLRTHFSALEANPTDILLPKLLRSDLNEIIRLNMQAIQRKSQVAEETATRATIWLSLTGTLCFLIAFTLLVNLPGNIANPIRELTSSIKAIAARNYNQRVHFDQHNELGELASAFNTMAARLEEYSNSDLSKILFEKQRIDTLINKMQDPIIGLDEQQNILFANDAALRITGLNTAAITGKAAAAIARDNDLLRYLVSDLSSSATEGDTGKKEPISIYADNKASYFEKEVVRVATIPAGAKEEKPIGNVIILKNITPFKELDVAKTNFIATVSHELKTPIASILMSVNLLNDKRIGTLSEEQQELARHIKDDSERLLRITGELLNLSQVETGKIKLNLQQSSVQPIIDYALNATRAAAEQKKVTIQVQIAAPLPDVRADSDKTAWVLTNLVSNAVRYSFPQSTVRISVSARDQLVCFTVADQGKGIEPQYVARIFDRYFQVPGSDQQGTGLGLSISKEFMEAQGGSISVHSEPGSGSSFRFCLQVAPDNGQA